MTTLFISDLHLHQDRPDAGAAFKRFLETDARQADALYILGDLFEIWVGDDDIDEHDQEIIRCLHQLTHAGTPCYFMHGNRDFMIGSEFALLSGIELLYDPTLIYVGGRSVLISHGDFMCTDDKSYQRYRKFVRNPRNQRISMAFPAACRTWLGNRIRKKSIANGRTKPPEIQDVNAQAVRAAMLDYGVQTIIHGHTHRPAIHDISLDGTPAQRIVLGDWYEQGSILNWGSNGPRLSALPF